MVGGRQGTDGDFPVQWNGMSGIVEQEDAEQTENALLPSLPPVQSRLWWPGRVFHVFKKGKLFFSRF